MAYISQIKQVVGECQIFLQGDSEQNTGTTDDT